MRTFVHEQSPVRVVFGAGALAALPAEVERLGATRALVLATPGRRARAEAAGAGLGARCAGVFAGAEMHVPAEVARAARDAARALRADLAVALGGGSTIGLAKAVALELPIPILAIPTTYSGSEMTPIHGVTEGGAKRTGRDPRVAPRTVIYDPELTVSLPARLAATSGMNAIAHAAEGLYAQDASPLVAMMAEEGIRALAGALPRIAAAPRDLEARGECLYGAWLCGAVLGAAGMALHHKLCHVLGGTWNLPHAETHAIVLPHAVAYNAPAAPDAMRRIARALGAREAATGLYDLARSLGAPLALQAIGMREADLDRAAALAVQSPYHNPRPIDPAAIRALLADAYAGRRPAA